MAQAGIAAIGLKADQVELVYIDKAKGTMDVYAFRRDEWMPAATGALVSMREGLRTAQRIHPERGHWRCRSCEFHTRCGND